ncbi:MAG: adenylate/guanylate cyclase domain-containing protein [Bacteroidota bacterium]
MRHSYLFLILLLIPFGLSAQDNLSALQQQLEQAQNQMEKMNLSIEIGDLQQQKRDYREAVKSYEVAHNIARQLRNTAIQAQTSYKLYEANAGLRSETNQNYWLNRTLELAKAVGDSDLIIKATVARSRIWTRKGNYRQAYLLNEEAFEYFSQKGTSITELEQKFTREQQRLQKDRNQLEAQRNELIAQRDTLAREIGQLRGEKDQLSSDNQDLQVQTEQLTEAKQQVEQEVSAKTEELENVAQEKAVVERIAAQRGAEVKQLSRDTLEKQLIIQEAKNQLMESKMAVEHRNQIILGSAGGLLFFILTSLLLYSRFKTKKRSAKALAAKNEEIQRERKRSEELLLNILPATIAEELKSTGKAKAQHFKEVTVFFSDFKNFTRDAEALGPEKLVEELDKIFRKFDEIISQYPDIEKIKTIGDAYMCASGFTNRTTLPNNLVKAALEMQAYLAEKAKTQPRLSQARIGLHTGEVTAGVVGSKKFAYDIWGDTVNIASRMESKGEPGRVNISGETYGRINYRFNCTARGKIQAKNKGFIDMYFVEGEKAF